MELTKTRNGILGRFMKNGRIALIFSILILLIVFSLLSEYFFTFRNFMNILQYSAILGVVAAGCTFVIISGSLEISVGSIVALVSVFVAYALKASGNHWVGIATGLLIGLACGAVNGLLITKVKINPLITTLGTMTIFRGLAYIRAGGISFPVSNEKYKYLGQGYLLEVPMIVWILVGVFLLLGLTLRYTAFGRQVYSVGGNPQASYLSGINIHRVRFFIYVISGCAAGISGILYASLTGAGAPGAAIDLPLEAISAVILGGAALAGGRGSIVGTALGVLILAIISNGFVLLNISSFYQMIFKGFILILSVTIGVLRGESRYV